MVSEKKKHKNNRAFLPKQKVQTGNQLASHSFHLHPEHLRVRHQLLDCGHLLFKLVFCESIQVELLHLVHLSTKCHLDGSQLRSQVMACKGFFIKNVCFGWKN